MSKQIITIARQYGSGGKTVGRMLAKRLGIPCYGREIIDMASEESGIHPALFQDERVKRGFFARLKNGAYKEGGAASPESADFVKDDNLFQLQAGVIRHLAEEGPCVIIGRCADHVLRERNDVVRVFVYANDAFCLQEAMKVNSLPENEVRALIARKDAYRARYYEYYTGKKWNDARNYDLCLNSAKLGFDGTAEAILAYCELCGNFQNEQP